MILADFKFSDLHWITPSKGGIKIVVGFDTYKKTVIICRVTKLNFSGADRQDFPYRENFLSEEFFAEIKEIFKVYSATLTNEKLAGVYLVLPDRMLSFDAVTIPQMFAKKRETVLSAHFNNILKDSKNYKMRRYLAAAYKKTYTYLYAFTKEENVQKIESALGENKLSPKFTLFAASARLNGAIHLKSNLRKKNFILLDIKEDYSDISISYRGRCYGFSHLAIGFKHLSNHEVLQENMLYNHDAANLFILNAQEKAKSKKLTVSKDSENADLEAVADDVIHQLEQGVNLNVPQEKVPQAEKEEKSAPLGYSGPTVFGQPITPLKEEDEDEEEIEEGEESEEETSEEEKGRHGKVFTRKTPKKLPKYMFRDEPTDEKGYIYENFRMFAKWAMLSLKWLQEKEFLQEFDSVAVNIPKEFAFVVERANEEGDKSDLPFELVERNEDNNGVPLEAIGGLYAGVYNKRLNF